MSLLLDVFSSLKIERNAEDRIQELIFQEPTKSSNKKLEQFNFPNSWWLEKAFNKIHLAFIPGCFLVYFCIVLPHIGFIISANSPENELWVQQNFFYVIRDSLFIAVPLILIRQSFNHVKKLKDNFNEYLLERKVFKSPIKLLANNQNIEKIDENYLENFLKSFSFKTLQLAMNLSFDKKYLIGFAIIVGIISSITVIYQDQLEAVSIMEYPGGNDYWLPYVYVKIFFLWSILAILTWTTICCLILSLHASKYTFDFFPQKPIMEYFRNIYDLTGRFWKIGSFIVAIQLPTLFFDVYYFGSEHGDDWIKNATDFVFIWVYLVIPVVIVGTIIGIHFIHNAMKRSKERKMILMEQDIRKLRKLTLMEENSEKYASRFTILSNEFKDLIYNVDTPITSKNTVTIIATIAGPPTSAVFGVIPKGIIENPQTIFKLINGVFLFQ